MRTAVPGGSVPSVPAVKASCGTVACSPSTPESVRSRSKSKSSGFGWNSLGISHSMDCGMFPARQWRFMHYNAARVRRDHVVVKILAACGTVPPPRFGDLLDKRRRSNYLGSTLGQRVLTVKLLKCDED